MKINSLFFLNKSVDFYDDESVTYQKDGTAINITYTTPDDSDYSIEAIAAGRTDVEDGLYRLVASLL